MLRCTQCKSTDITIRGTVTTCNKCYCVHEKKVPREVALSGYTLPLVPGATVEAFIDGSITRDSAVKATIISAEEGKIKVQLFNFYTEQNCKLTFYKLKRSGLYTNTKWGYTLAPEGSGRHGWGPANTN